MHLLANYYSPQLQKESNLNQLLLAAAEMILARDGDVVNAHGTATRRIQYDGTAVHMAVEHGYHHILNLLLTHGADANVGSK